MRRAPAAVLLALLLAVVAGLAARRRPGMPAARGPRPGGRARCRRHLDLDGDPLHRRPRGGTGPRRRRHHGGQREAQQGQRRHASPATSTTASTWPSSPRRGPSGPRRTARPVKVDLAKRKGYRLVTVLFRENIYYRRDGTRPAHLRPAGRRAALRERHPRRIGVRDVHGVGLRRPGVGPGRGARAASGWRSSARTWSQEPDAKGLQVWSATTTRPLDWYAWVTATNDEALTRDRLALEGGDEVVIRGWPEDKRWRGRVRDLLRDGVPALVDRIGLAWPVDGVTRHLRGAHAAARGLRRLLRSRDGRDHDQRGPRRPHDHPRGVARLVQQVAVHRALDHRGTRRRVRGARPAGARPRLPGPAGVERQARRPRSRSSDWPPPAAIRDEESEARESYGYDGQLVPDAQDREARGRGRDAGRVRGRRRGHHGLSGRGATRAESPAQRLAAVPGPRAGRGERRGRGRGRRPGGEGRARRGRPRSSCRRVRPRGARTPTWSRRVATWAAPVVVRMAMDRWDFDDATEAMDRAADVLAVRDEIAEAGRGGGPGARGPDRRRTTRTPGASRSWPWRRRVRTAASRSCGRSPGQPMSSRPRGTGSPSWASMAPIPRPGVAAARAAWEAGGPRGGRDRGRRCRRALAARPGGGPDRRS